MLLFININMSIVNECKAKCKLTNAEALLNIGRRWINKTVVFGNNFSIDFQIVNTTNQPSGYANVLKYSSKSLQ